MRRKPRQNSKFSPAIREAATRLQIVFETYGNVANKPLNEETSAIYNLLQELQGKYAADIATVGIAEWATELKSRNIAFEIFVKERFDETVAKTDIVLKKARAELDEAYRAIVERVNALIVVEGVADYEVFAKTLNAIIAKYHSRRHHHSSEPRFTGLRMNRINHNLNKRRAHYEKQILKNRDGSNPWDLPWHSHFPALPTLSSRCHRAAPPLC